jgi:thiol-disulfide isomerase/thioredoxin
VLSLGVNAVKQFWSRLAIVLCCLILLAILSTIAFFQVAEKRIAARERSPILEMESQPVPDLPFRTLDGKLRYVSELKGKVVFLDLWGTWCIQCVAEMPTVQKLYDRYRNDPNVEFLIVSRLDSVSAVRAYARRNHFDLPFYVTRNEDVPNSMQLGQYPATFLYARDGTVAAQHTGAADWSSPSVIAFIDRLKER